MSLSDHIPESRLELAVADIRMDTSGEVVIDGVSVGSIARHISLDSRVGDLTHITLTISRPPAALLLKTLVAIAEGKLTQVPIRGEVD